MSTPSICSKRLGTACGIRRRRVGALALVLMMLPAGCGYTGGKLLYMLGVGKGGKVEAKFRLTEDRVLILIDDPGGRIPLPGAKRFLFEALTNHLLDNEAADQLLPYESVIHLRQSEPEFERRGCREIGKLAGATQVLWIEVRAFLADPQITDPNDAAHFSVTVKVIDATEERRPRVRLWPTSRRGHAVTATLSGSDVSRAKTKRGIAKALAEELAEKVAKLFYDYRLGDFEREE